MSVPQGFAVPNATLNRSINQGNALVAKLVNFGVIVTGLYVNPIGEYFNITLVPINQAQAVGVTPDDPVHLVFKVLGSADPQEVAVVADSLSPSTGVDGVSALLRTFAAMFGEDQAVSKTLQALTNNAAVQAALKAQLS